MICNIATLQHYNIKVFRIFLRKTFVIRGVSLTLPNKQQISDELHLNLKIEIVSY